MPRFVWRNYDNDTKLNVEYSLVHNVIYHFFHTDNPHEQQHGYTRREEIACDKIQACRGDVGQSMDDGRII